MTWQPIETAPRDGRPFLAMSDHIISPTGFLVIWMAEKHPDDPWFRAVYDHEPLHDATHWAEIPIGTVTPNPLCAYCLRKGIATEATVCDHCTPHKGDAVKFWAGPFQSLCVPCHNRVKKLEEGGKGVIGGDTQGNPIDPNHHWNS